MSKRNVKLAGLVTAVGLLGAACGGGGNSAAEGEGSEEEFNFRVADQYSMEHSIGVASIQPYMKAVEEASDGRITFEYFSDDALVAAEDVPEAITSGTADLGNLVYIGNLNPLLYTVQLPGLFSDDETVAASEAFFEYVKANESTQQSFEELNIVPLFCFTVTNYQMQFAKPGVETLDDVEGSQVRTAGVVLPHSIAALGAQPSDIAINEAYDAMNRGVIDSISLSVPSVKTYAFMELIESAIVNTDLGGFPVCYGMGRDQFDGLPGDLQDLMLEEGEKIVTDASTHLVEEAMADLATWEEEGIELFEVDEAERDEKLADVEQRWLKQLESEGVEGAEDAIAQWKSILEEHLG